MARMQNTGVRIQFLSDSCIHAFRIHSLLDCPALSWRLNLALTLHWNSRALSADGGLKQT